MMSNEKGFTLIENLVSVVVLSLLISVTLAFFSQSSKMNKRSRELTTAIFLAQDKIEEIKGTPFTVIYSEAPRRYEEKIIVEGESFIRKVILTVENEMVINVEVEVITKKGREIYLATHKRYLSETKRDVIN